MVQRGWYSIIIAMHMVVRIEASTWYRHANTLLLVHGHFVFVLVHVVYFLSFD